MQKRLTMPTTLPAIPVPTENPRRNRFHRRAPAHRYYRLSALVGRSGAVMVAMSIGSRDIRLTSTALLAPRN